MSQGNVADLVRRLKGVTRFMRAGHAHRRLFEECIDALTDISVQLHAAKAKRAPDYTIRTIKEDANGGSDPGDAAVPVPQDSVGAEDPAR